MGTGGEATPRTVTNHGLHAGLPVVASGMHRGGGSSRRGHRGDARRRNPRLRRNQGRLQAGTAYSAAELVTRPASLDDVFFGMKNSHGRPGKGFAVAVRLVDAAGRPRGAIRKGALLARIVQATVNEVAPGTEVDLVIPHRYTERLARPPSRRNEMLLRLKDVLKRTGLSRSTLYRLERAGEFPKRRELSKNIIAWGEREVLAWMMNRKRRGSDGYRA